MIYSSGLLQSVLRHPSSRVIAGFLSFALVVVTTLLVPSIAVAKSTLPPAPEILVFPFTNNAGSTYDSLASVISGNVRLKINALGYYRSAGYSVLNPSLQRALNVDNTLSVDDLTAPTATPDRAEKIASLVGTPYFFVGNIDTVTVDPDSGTVTVAIDGTLYDSSSGAVIKQANVTGVAAPVSKTYDPAQIQSSAIDSAAGKLVAATIGPQFTKPSTAGEVSSSRGSGSKIGAGILFILTVVLALVLIHNHGHSNTNSTSSSTTGGTTTGGTSTTGTTGTTGTTTTTSTTGSTTGPPAPPS